MDEAEELLPMIRVGCVEEVKYGFCWEENSFKLKR